MLGAERCLTPAEQEQQRSELRSNWDFSAILDCLEVFEEEIDLKEQPSISSLEDDLVSSAGAGPGVLRDVHEVRLLALRVYVGAVWNTFSASYGYVLVLVPLDNGAAAGAPNRQTPALSGTGIQDCGLLGACGCEQAN